MPRFTKKQNQVFHAKRRAAERFGIELNKDLRKRIIRMIQTGRAQFVERYSHRRSRFIFKVDGVKMPVIYDKVRHTLATVLPPESIPGSVPSLR